MELQGILPDITATGAKVATISNDKLADRNKLRTRLGLTFPIYGDPGRPVISGWGVADPDFEIPRSALFIVRNGKIAYAYLGDPPWEDVLAALSGK